MQKKLIALALASLAGSAFAQTNVTVYGVADGTFEFAKATGATIGAAGNTASQTRLSSNSSLLGFKGVEDLGNGLKALFQFESGIDFTGDGATSWNTTRDSFVGLTGGFGTVVAGTLTHPIRTMGAKVDFNPGASSSGFTGSIYGEFLGVKTGTDERAKNAIAYVSPNFSGFTVTAAYLSGGIAGANDNGNTDAKNDSQVAKSFHSQQYQIAGQYENGPIYVGLGYHQANNPRALAAVFSGIVGVTCAETGTSGCVTGTDYKDKLTAWRLAGKYAFSTGTTVSALYDSQKYSFESDTISGGDNVKAKRVAWMVGVNQNFMAKHNVWLQYAKANKAKIDGETQDETGANQWTVGYSYDMSKRTMLHGFYTQLNNQDFARYDNYVNGTLQASSATSFGMGLGANAKVLGLGMRHTF